MILQWLEKTDMNELLKIIYDMLYNRTDSPELVTEIEDCHRQLIERLDKPERKLVLQIIDGKDRIADELSMDSFICGFQLGTRLAAELNLYERTHPICGAPLKRYRD